jgi:hypothetical protein
VEHPFGEHRKHRSIGRLGMNPMRRPQKWISPRVEVMESRALPSAATPLLTMHSLHGIVRDVRAIVRTLSATDAIGQANAHLGRLASRIPGGSAQLAPAWRNDVALYSPHTAKSGGSVEKRLLDDLSRFVRGGAGATGPGSTIPPPIVPSPESGQGLPAPALSLDSVSIRNTTGLDLLVTVRLKVPQVQQPWITQTVPAQGSPVVPFNFGTATDAFMAIDVRRADGGQSPPPLTGFSLPQPMNGYNGALFTISLFGPYFNVSPG